MKFLRYLLPIFLLFPLGAYALTTYIVPQGGTGATSFSPNSIISSGPTPTSALRATSTQPLYVGSLSATTTATSTFVGGVQTGGLRSSGGLVVTGGSLQITSGATSTGSNGINLSGGCFSINNVCAGTGAGTVTSITAGAGLTGGVITTTGTVALDLTATNIFSGLQTYTNSGTSTWSGGLFSTKGFDGKFATLQQIILGTGSASSTITGGATTTFSGGIQSTALGLSGPINGSGTATSTLANGFNLSEGCFSINGVCVGGATAPGGSDTQLQYNNGSVFGGTSGFVWDDVNLRVGLGTTSPGAQFTIQSAADSTTSLFNIASTSGASLLSVNATGTLNVLGKTIAPSLIGSVNVGTGQQDVAVAGDYLFAASLTTDTITSYNISDPTRPVQLGTITDASLLDGPETLKLVGQRLYVSTRNRDSVALIDVSNPKEMHFVSEMRGPVPGTTMNYSYGMCIAGNIVYVPAYSGSSFNVIDWTDASNPVFLSSITSGLVAASWCVVEGGWAYLTSTGNDTVKVYDVSNPRAPVEVGSVADATNLDGAGGLDKVGNTLYVGTVVGGTAGKLTMIDVSNPYAPRVVNSIANVGDSYSLTAFGNILVTQSFSGGSISVWDLASTTLPSRLSTLKGTPLTSIINGRFAKGIYYTASQGGYIGIVNLQSVVTGPVRFASANIGEIEVDSDARIRRNFSVDGSGSFGNGGIFSSGPILVNATTSTSIAGAFMGKVGVGTSSPYAKLSVTQTGTAGAPAFLVEDSASPDTSPFVITETGNVGIGTTSPYTLFSMSGGAFLNDTVAATSSFFGAMTMGTTSDFVYENGSGNTYINQIVSGAQNFDNDAGQISWVDMPLASTTIVRGTPTSYTASINGFPALTVYGEHDGSGSASTTRVAVGTTTPYAQLTVWGGAIGGNTAPVLFDVLDSASSTKLKVLSGGNVGVASSSPWRTFSVVGTMANSGMTGATAGTNNDVCITVGGDFINETTGTCIVSSRRYKHDIETLDLSAVDYIKALRPVTFSPNSDDVADFDDTQYGFIAEEVAEVDPRFAKYGTDGLPRTLDDRALLSVAIKAIQEQDARIELLENGGVSKTDTRLYMLALGILALFVAYQQRQINSLTCEK